MDQSTADGSGTGAVPWSWRGFAWLMRRLPQGGLSRAAGRLADVPLPRLLRRPVLGGFAWLVGIDLHEAELPLVAYPTLDAFFTRRLRPGCRPQPADPEVVTSPVDGTLGELGAVAGGTLVQAKGLTYGLAELLGDATAAARYEGGSFVTVYLSPRDYHRIHAPAGGAIGWARHEPGRLLPVNRPLTAVEPRLFARNERLVCEIANGRQRFAVVAVGAMNVGRISADFDPGWNGPRGGVANRRRATPATRSYQPAVVVARGEQLMTFHLGSTVVLLLGPAAPPLLPSLRSGAPVRLGEPFTGGW